MKTFRAFGPTIGKGKLSRKFINTINTQIDKSIITKKNDYSSKLASQIKNELKLPNSFIEKNLSKELIRIKIEAVVAISLALPTLINKSIGLKKIPPPIPITPDTNPIDPPIKNEVTLGILLLTS